MCFICIQFSSEQKKKLKAKKAYQHKKSKDIPRDEEDSLLGPDETPSTTAATTSTASASTEKESSSSSDPCNRGNKEAQKFILQTAKEGYRKNFGESDKLSTGRDEGVDDDPSYWQVLAYMRN